MIESLFGSERNQQVEMPKETHVESIGEKSTGN